MYEFTPKLVDNVAEGHILIIFVGQAHQIAYIIGIHRRPNDNAITN